MKNDGNSWTCSTHRLHEEVLLEETTERVLRSVTGQQAFWQGNWNGKLGNGLQWLLHWSGWGLCSEN